MAAEIHVDDIGTSLQLLVKDENGAIVDISTATLQVWIRKPDLSVLTKTGTLVNDGTDGLMQYVTVSGDLDTAGKWAIQGFVEFSNGTEFHTDVHHFRVYDNLQ